MSNLEISLQQSSLGLLNCCRIIGPSWALFDWMVDSRTWTTTYRRGSIWATQSRQAQQKNSGFEIIILVRTMAHRG